MIPTSAGLEAGKAEREIGWLIERKYPVNSIGATEPRWYAERPNGDHWWTPVPNEAKRFASKAEAEAYPAYGMIAKDPAISVTEHVWINDGFSWSHGRSALTPPARAVEAVDDNPLTPMSGFLVFLKDMRFTGSWDVPTLDRAIEVGETIAAQSNSALIPPSRTDEPTGEIVPAGIAELVARHTIYDDTAGVSTRMGDLRAVAASLTALSAKLAEVERARDANADHARLANANFKLVDKARADLRRKLEEARTALGTIAKPGTVAGMHEQDRALRLQDIAARALSSDGGEHG